MYLQCKSDVYMYFGSDCIIWEKYGYFQCVGDIFVEYIGDLKCFFCSINGQGVFVWDGDWFLM